MVSLKVIYQIVLILWFASLVWIFSNISDIGYKHPVQSVGFDITEAAEQDTDKIPETPQSTERVRADDEDYEPQFVKRKEEIPAEILKCPLPDQTRTFPFCQDNVVRLWDHGDEPCFKRFGVNKRNDCSILSYLSEVERWCPLLSGRNKSREDKASSGKAKLRKDLSGLLELLPHSYYKWMRTRMSDWWPEWTKGVDLVHRKYKNRSRSKKKVLIFLGTFAEVPTFFFAAADGGALGELVQWSDLIATIYLLGHDLTVSANKERVPEFLGRPDADGCISDKDRTSPPNYDLIFTDIAGVGIIKTTTGPLYSRYKCRLRVVDSFGTDAEFNYHGYKKPIPGGESSWGKLDLNLRQFMTMFPHSPDNTFLGFVAGVKMNKSESARVIKKKQDKCLVYGKVLEYWRGRIDYLKLISKYFEVHSTTVHQVALIERPDRVKLPGFVKNYGIVGHRKLMNLLQESKLFVGMGFPYEGPAPFEAIANGAVFLNPKLDPPRNRVNTDFFKGKPTLRSLTSQSPYLEEFVGKPYVYTIDIDNHTLVEQTVKEILKTKVAPFLPLEFTCEGMLERVDALVENQDFCEGGSLWLPLKKLRIILGRSGESCKDACKARGLICEPAYWEVINKRAFLTKLRKCGSFEPKAVLYAPSVDGKNGVCRLQDNVMLFSCVARQPSQERLCPCREFRKEQVALCEGCF